MNGTIHDTTGSGPFHNVTLYFYTEEGSLRKVYFGRQGNGTYVEETATARGELPVEPA